MVSNQRVGFYKVFLIQLCSCGLGPLNVGRLGLSRHPDGESVA